MLFNAGIGQRVKVVLATTYDSKATVYRNSNTKVGSVTKQQPQAVYTDMPCRRSKTTQGAINPTTGAATFTDSLKLFCSPEWAIETGDRIVVTGPPDVPGKPATYFAGDIAPYPTHQEIKLEIRRRA